MLATLRLRPQTTVSSEVELAVLGAAHEGVPLSRGEQQDRTGGVLAVPHGHAAVERCHLDAVAAEGAG